MLPCGDILEIIIIMYETEATYMPSPLFSRRELARLIVPLIIERALETLVGMADVVMVSGVGEAAVSGVSLVNMLNILLVNIFAALATGGAVVTSQLIGARNNKRACESASQLIVVSGLAGAVICLAVLAFRVPVLRFFFGTIDDDVMQACLTYFTICALSYPFLAIYNACAALFRSMGNSNVSMCTSAFMNVVNIAGNAICVYGLKLGVAGVALPSLIARIIAAAIMMKLIFDQALPVHVKAGERFKFDKPLVKSILRIGMPSAAENGMFQLGRVLVVSIISTFGTVQIAANAVANNIDSVGTIPAEAMSLAMITVVGRCVGAGDMQMAGKYTKKLLALAYAATAALNVVIFTFLNPILGMYNLSPETQKLSIILICIHNGFAVLMWPSAFTLANAMRAANDVKYTMLVAIFAMWVFRLGLSYVLGSMLGMGAIGVWVGMICDWVFRTVCYVWRFASGKWKQMAKA